MSAEIGYLKMMEKKTGTRFLEAYKNRQTNLETLRIFAMLMIIVFHIVSHCIVIQLTDKISIDALNNGWFNTPAFARKLMAVEAVMPWGATGNAIFILLTGYFLCGKPMGLEKCAKSAKKLMWQLGYVILLLVSVSCIYGSLKKEEAYQVAFINLKAFSGSFWFAGYYCLILLVAACFLNRMISRYNRIQFKSFLIVILASFSFYWSGALIDSLASGMRTLFAGIFLYAMGGYIRKYSPFERLRTWFVVILIPLIYLVIMISYHNVVMSEVMEYQISGGRGEFIQVVPGFVNYEIVPLVLGILIFELFRRMRIPRSAVINYISSGVFMIYLLHDNPFVYGIWKETDWITVLYQEPGRYLLILSEWTLVVFGLGFAGYLFYRGLIRLLNWGSRFVLLPANEESGQQLL
ncbi:MAG: hypothetical protein J6N77_05045 [Lachnospiraceae bacterium]|nr:hypothetical protein [Lachnospiraceae bacterium]